MKVKIFKITMIFLIILSSCSSSYKNEDFLGTYNLEGMCEDMLSNGNTFPDERYVVITKGIESDLLIYINSISDTAFKAFVSNDSLFIPSQKWDNFDGTQASFKGEGKITNGFLFLHYSAGGTFGNFECECKGKKID